MAYEALGRQLAEQLAADYGTLREARLESKSPWRIVLVFSRGEFVVPSNHMFKFGYGGSGPDCFHAFLQASGFSISKDRVEKAKEGDVFYR